MSYTTSHGAMFYLVLAVITSFLRGKLARLHTRDSRKSAHLARKRVAALHYRLLPWCARVIRTKDVSDDLRLAIMADEKLSMVCTGVLRVLVCAVKLRLKDTDLSRDLASVNMPQQYADDLVKAYKAQGESLREAASRPVEGFPSIVDLNWRVDVTISTTSLSRAFQPTVLMQVTLSNKQIRTFELSVERFHQLRYSVAKALKSMQDLKQHPTLLRDI